MGACSSSPLLFSPGALAGQGMQTSLIFPGKEESQTSVKTKNLASNLGECLGREGGNRRECKCKSDVTRERRSPEQGGGGQGGTPVGAGDESGHKDGSVKDGLLMAALSVVISSGQYFRGL